ncbi:MAG: OmpA family protein [Salinivirgaceae bacterium]|nr:OmpA family protein [Salinivirgaceae bacterium]MBO7433815.1 OmpA family protein [Salinivirgaceae bacterium]MBR5167719.1 OmpA family protein [Salinivirgaceae bacterium]
MSKYSRTLMIAAMAGLTACVPSKQFQELKEKNEAIVAERDSVKSLNEDLTVKSTELEAQVEELNKKLETEAGTKSVIRDSAMFYKKQYKVFKTMYDDLNDEQEKQTTKDESEMRQLMADLQVSKQDLLEKERILKEKQQELDERDAILVALDSNLNMQRRELAEKNRRVQELETILNQKDSSVRALKQKISQALLGFEDKGLTVEQRNGKVYVTMDEKLLFKSGKWDVDPKGQAALKQIAGVLAANTDVNIMIEGHTDDVPMKGTGDIQDNWDLSAKRATTIVKLLVNDGKIDGKRISAAGRSQYSPIDPAKTSEARAKNRRTEIILTPKLDEIFRILETN